MAYDVLRLDGETYAAVDLPEVGLYRYARDPSFEILLMAGQLNDGPVVCWDLAQGERIPPEIQQALVSPDVIKVAWNAYFEFVTLQEHFVGMQFDIRQWRCSMTHAMMLGLPAKLSEAAIALKLPQEQRKSAVGRQLIKYFCGPCKPTKANGMRSRNLPRDDPAKWELFIDYNKQDVVTESSVLAALDGLGTFIPGEGGDEWMQREHRFWAEIDHPINARGVPIDGAFVDGAIKMDGDYRAELEAKMTRMAGIENPNSAPQFKAWMLKETGVICDALNKETMPELLRTAPTDLVREMLQLREEIAQTASVKYHAARRAAGPDDRVRGLLQFNGAPRTGRWSGRLVQIHNMKKGVSPIFDALREAVKRGDRDFVDMWFGGVNTALGHLVRSIFAPAPGRVFVGGDWSAIEAVNLAWLADEKWRREVFATHGKLYEVSASKMFNVPWSEFQAYIDQKKKHPLRQKAKVAELALGFQGGPGAMITMGALDEGIPESELPGIVDAWRLASPRISNWDDGLWIRLQNAAIACVLSGRAIEVKVGPDNCSAVWFEIRRNKLGYKVLQMHLPCGRRLSYFDPQVAKDPKFGKSAVNYKGVNDKKQWNVIWSYGGKWTENLDQAMAASILREALDALRDDPAAFHVHDEIQLEESIERASALAARLKAVMERPLKWAPGLILKAETEILPYYRKTD